MKRTSSIFKSGYQRRERKKPHAKKGNQLISTGNTQSNFSMVI
jgi:hypothetical protein